MELELEAKSLPRVSVVIPAYNAARFIERTLRSALAQTHANLQVLVIDDGSTDATVAIAREVGGNDPRLEIISVENGGVASARNIGTERADGDYIAYLDADDLWHPTKIARQVAALTDPALDARCVAAYANYRMIDGDDYWIEDVESPDGAGSLFGDHLSNNCVGNGSNLMVRRDVALAVGGFDPLYARQGIGGCEDFDFQLRMLREWRMVQVDQFLVGYRTVPGNMSSNLGRMTRGYKALVDKFEHADGVSEDQHRAARLTYYAMAAESFVGDRDWRRAAGAFARAMTDMPLAALPRMARGYARAIRRDARRILRNGSAGGGQHLKIRFDDLGPDQRPEIS